METKVDITWSGLLPWTIEAEHALQETFANELGRARTIRNVRAGKWHLMKVFADGELCGWMVTEQFKGSELFVWCYQGKRFYEVSRALAKLADAHGWPHIGWLTFHLGAVRRYRKFSPTIDYTALPGEMRFQFDSARLANG
jgi:hypothetical protein